MSITLSWPSPKGPVGPVEVLVEAVVEVAGASPAGLAVEAGPALPVPPAPEPPAPRCAALRSANVGRIGRASCVISRRPRSSTDFISVHRRCSASFAARSVAALVSTWPGVCFARSVRRAA